MLTTGKKIVIFLLSVCFCIVSNTLISTAAIKNISLEQDKTPSPSAVALVASQNCKNVATDDSQNELAKKIVRYMEANGYRVDKGEKEYNIVYIEGACANGAANADELDLFNDRRILLEFVNGEPTITNNWSATSEPGQYYIENPLNNEGAALIAFGQYKNAWKVDIHKGPSGKINHEGLVQVGKVAVHRDANRDGKRGRNEPVRTGNFGINQHGGNADPGKRIGRYSAGCLVGWKMEGHKKFMSTIKQDARYQKNNGYRFTTTVINGDKLAAAESITDDNPSSEETDNSGGND